MRLVVTGATGFIGTQVMGQAAEMFPGESIGLARAAHSGKGEVRHLSVDLRDREAVHRLMAELRPTHLLHLAWDVTPGRYWNSLSNLEWLEASLHLFRAFAAGGGKRIVAAGTCAEYDWSDEVLVEGRTALRPNSLYGTAKNCLREMLSSAAPALGVSWAWGRLFWLYGPGESSGRLISDLARGILTGDEVPTSSGRQRRDYLYVADTARALLHVLQSDFEGAINIGSGEALEVRELSMRFADKMGRLDLLRLGARGDSGNDPPCVVADVTKLGALGFRPRWDLDTGISATADWWKRTAQEVNWQS